MNLLEVALKLLLAVALGGLIGLERESSQKPAGFRTNILICLGSTMMMIFSELLFQGSGQNSGDMTRIAAGVVTGLGFIGAGTIIQAQGSIVGLTTAATLWAVGGLGLVIGSGHYMVALIYTGIIILTLVIFRRFESLSLKRSLFRYYIKAKYSKTILSDIKKMALHEGIKFRDISHEEDGKTSTIYLCFPASDEKEQNFKWSLLNLKGLYEIKVE